MSDLDEIEDCIATTNVLAAAECTAALEKIAKKERSATVARFARKALGMTRDELAEVLGVPVLTVLETEKRGFDDVVGYGFLLVPLLRYAKIQYARRS